MSAALNTSVSTKEDEEPIENPLVEIITTPEELEIYTLCKLIIKDTIDLNRVYYRDNKNYFNVLLDDNIRKWILRFYMNNAGMKIELNNGEKILFELSNPMDVTNYSNQLVEIVNIFLRD